MKRSFFNLQKRRGFFRNISIDVSCHPTVVWHISLRIPSEMGSNIHIATSGWSYKHWKGIFYPPKLKPADWLQFYSNHFQCTEVDGSFYKLPTEETVIDWKQKVPDNFLFCPKMSRFLTHMKKLNDPEEPLQRFFGIFEPMREMMGPVLLQLPEILKFNYDKAEHLFRLMKAEYKQYEFVMEVRHSSWFQEESLTLMTKYDVGLVISQSSAFPYSEIITAKNIYIRFHGPQALYASSYSDDLLKDFAKKFEAWQKEGHVIWAFFNNDIHGYAIGDALRLLSMVEK